MQIIINNVHLFQSKKMDLPYQILSTLLHIKQTSTSSNSLLVDTIINIVTWIIYFICIVTRCIFYSVLTIVCIFNFSNLLRIKNIKCIVYIQSLITFKINYNKHATSITYGTLHVMSSFTHSGTIIVNNIVLLCYAFDCFHYIVLCFCI